MLIRSLFAFLFDSEGSVVSEQYLINTS
jgi:hypothetical protein